MNHPQPLSTRHRDPLNGAAVIDDQGREIPITEAMILRACDLAIGTCVASQYRAMHASQRPAWWPQAQRA